jgi:hypothetical protein
MPFPGKSPPAKVSAGAIRKTEQSGCPDRRVILHGAPGEFKPFSCQPRASFGGPVSGGVAKKGSIFLKIVDNRRNRQIIKEIDFVYIVSITSDILRISNKKPNLKNPVFQSN